MDKMFKYKYYIDKKLQKMSKDLLQLQFNQATLKRNELSDIPNSFQQILMFMDYRIRKQLKSFTLMSICGSNRQNFMVDSNFQRAFGTLTLQQKINQYDKQIKVAHVVKNDNKKNKQVTPQMQELNITLFLMRKSKIQEKVNIKQFKVITTTSKGAVNIDLRNYLMRKSKKKDRNWYVLQAINNSNPETLRFAFVNESQQNKYLSIIQKRLYWSNYFSIKKFMDQIQRRKIMINRSTTKQFKLKIANQKDQVIEQKKQKQFTLTQNKQFLDIRDKQQISSLGNQSKFNKSICEDLIKSVQQQDFVQKLSKFNQVRNQEMTILGAPTYQTQDPLYRKNIFRILLPNYPLHQLSGLMHYGSLYKSNISQLFVYHHNRQSNVFKLKININLSAETTLMAIYNVHLYKQWHPHVKQGQIKMNISSQNSCILYQQHKPYSQWYRNRDFVVLTHLFKLDKDYFIAQKSIQHTYFIPFHSITRGRIQYMIWMVQPKQEHSCQVTAQLKIMYQGMLNKSHQKQMTERYLKGFQYMESYFSKIQNIGKLNKNMIFDWQISQNKLHSSPTINKQKKLYSFQTVDFEEGSQISIDEDQIFYSIQDMSNESGQDEQEPSEHEVDEQQLKNSQLKMLTANKTVFISEQGIQDIRQTFNIHQKQKIQFDKQGLVILPHNYISKKFPTQPFQTQIIQQQFPNNNIVLKDHWILKKSGGLKLINQKKIEAQNNVFSFIMKTLRSNLMSGKGLLNISLPVEIFNCDSNIQRICASMALAPTFLQRAVKQKNPQQRIKLAITFGFTNSVIYFDVQKPFNPILGQTYQGYIRGCPIYGEQTSHHPPISSLYFIGRGYKVFASLESKVNIHLNSGDGVNEGYYHINFDDGQQYLYQSPQGQLSGLSMGDRGFNFKNKGYIIDRKNNLYGEIRFQDTGSFFSKKKLKHDDEISGEIVEVRPQFLQKLLKSQKKATPSEKQIVKKISSISGRWPYTVQFDNQSYYDVLKDLPDLVVDQIYPLHSNSLYREDLQYRTLQDLSRSQIQKQRLEIKQRGDRKLREKYTGKKH